MTFAKSTNVVWHHATVGRGDRESLNGHKGAILWFTGLSGAGKSTLAHEVEAALFKQGCQTIVLDGDNVRHGLCCDLGFTDEDRKENIRRIGEVAKLFADAGVIVLTAFISPFLEDRRRVRNLAPEDFIEIHCDCDTGICEKRDVKGLYKKALAGEIKDFTGISSPDEPPVHPEIKVNTGADTLGECVSKIVAHLKWINIIGPQQGHGLELTTSGLAQNNDGRLG